MGASDRFVFTNLARSAKYLEKPRPSVTEMNFGVLLAALAVVLVLTGLSDLRVIKKTAH